MKQKFEQGVITLANHGEVHQDDSKSQRIADAIAIFSQMVQTLEAPQEVINIQGLSAAHLRI